MPLEKYDKYFGGKDGAAKAKAAMRKQYGERAEEVFYATMNKKKTALKRAGKTARKRRR